MQREKKRKKAPVVADPDVSPPLTAGLDMYVLIHARQLVQTAADDEWF
jgi:hypothetical protein